MLMGNDLTIGKSLLGIVDPSQCSLASSFEQSAMIIVVELARLCVYSDDPTERLQAEKLIVDFVSAGVPPLGHIFVQADAYAVGQHIDDAFPYHPNPFDILRVLALNGPDFVPLIITYLETVLRNDYGIPRWNAIATLCTIPDDMAENILCRVVDGHYEHKYSSYGMDRGVIMQRKGADFIYGN